MDAERPPPIRAELSWKSSQVLITVQIDWTEVSLLIGGTLFLRKLLNVRGVAVITGLIAFVFCS